METISAKENRIVKLYRSLATSARERREQGLMVLEGVRLCGEAAMAGAVVEQLLITQQTLEQNPQLQPLVESAQNTLCITPQLAEHIAQTKTSQGVYCICRIPQFQLPEPTGKSCFLLLERLQDPGNLGTIIRCAEAFGMAAVLLSQDSADPWSPKVLRSTMGSCFRQPVVICTQLTETVARLRAAGVHVYASVLDQQAVTPLEMTVGQGGVAIVIGNEGNGVSSPLAEACGHSVYIPMTQHIESLNAASAATVLMWELFGRGARM